jgi:cation diffusion facilitator CzcD-associated flavoprotein CzcO
VAVVGNGASAVQFVPRVAADSAQLTLFQRSPNYVGPKKDRAYGSTERQLLDRVRWVQLAYRWWIYLTLEVRWLWFRKDSWAGRTLTELFQKGIRNDVIAHGMSAASVLPDYPVGCKRILISNDWYPTLLRPEVDVVTTPVDHIESDAVVTADGTRYPADVLIFGTGFVTTEFLGHLPVAGRGGRTLADAWRDGARAYLGTAVPDFPNCYFLYGPNTNLGHNSILFMVERQVNLVLQAIAVQTRASDGGRTPGVAVSQEAYQREDERTQALMAHTTWVGTCSSWYKNASGRVTNNWPTWTIRFWFDTLRLRDQDLSTVDTGRPSSRTTEEQPLPAG